MTITGRTQGKYCNHLFKYDCTDQMMTYRAAKGKRDIPDINRS